jgi:hypothetical protein
MASINGLQNNALIVGTIDGLQTIYATAIYDNGVLLNPNGYVPYTGATGAVNLNGQNLTNVGQLSTTGVNTFSGVASGTTSTSSSYLALNATNQLVKTNIAPNIPVSAVNTGTWYPTFNATDTTGNVSTLYVDYTGALFYNPTTGTLSSTYFSGIASNATNATNATNVDLVQWTSGGGLIYLVGSSGYTTGYYTLESQNTLTFNPATNTLTASIFSGYATGGVFATTTSNIYLTGTDRSVAGNGGLYTQNLLYYDPSTYVLYTQRLNVSGTNLSTTPSWTLALDATNNVVRVAVGGNAATLTTTGTTSNTTYYPTFTTNYGTTPTALSYYTDSAAALTYNPSTHTLTTSQLTLSSIASGTPTTYIALNSSGQVVSYTPTGGSATTLLTTGTNSASTFYPVFTTAHSTTPTQLSYYTDSTSTPLSYVPSSETLTVGNLVANQLLAPAAVGNLTLGVSGSINSYLSLSAGTAAFNGSVLVAGGSVYTPALTSLTINSAFNWINFQVAGTTYLQMYASYLLMSNGMNAIQTTSQTFLHVAGASSATAAANFNFENVTPYGTLTTGTAAMNLLCSNATLGGVVASSTNGSSAATYGSSQMALQILAPSGTSGTAGTLTTYASVGNTGLSLQGGGGTLTITTFTYSPTTLLLVFTYASSTNYPQAGAYIAVSGLTGTPAALNGNYQVVSSTATTLTVQSYYGFGITYVSGGTITTTSPATAGITFGDLTTMSSHRAPLITIISVNGYLAGTPLANYPYYNPPVGTKYLRVRMCGGGGGGNCYNYTPNAGIGGYSRFGNYYAFGGNIGLGTPNPYWASTYYPSVSQGMGGLGGGLFQIAGIGTNTSTSAQFFISAALSTLLPTGIIVGASITISQMFPTQWNGTYTISSYTPTTVAGYSVQVITIPTSTTYSSSITTYGIMTVNPPDSNTFITQGGCGAGGYTSPNMLCGAMGGSCPLGFNTPGFFTYNPSGGLAAQPANAVGTYTFGGGGMGGSAAGATFAGNGGGAGQYVETYITIPNPLAPSAYLYSVGQGGQGSGGDAGARYNSYPGYNGVIIVEAYF